MNFKKASKAFADDKAGVITESSIAAVLYLQNKRAPREVVLINKDINMRFRRAKGAGVRFVEDYQTDQLIDDIQYPTNASSNSKAHFGMVSTTSKAKLGGKTLHTLAREPFELDLPQPSCDDKERIFAARVEEIDTETITLRLKPNA